MRVGIIGAGSIGQVLAAGFERLGHTVAINDADPKVEARLDYPAVSKAAMATQADVTVVAVPTPTPSIERGGDASAVREAVGQLSDHDPRGIVLIRSTMPPGSTAPLADAVDVPIVYSPEFLRDRSTVADFFDPDRIVVAGPDDAVATVRELLAPVREESGAEWIETDYLSAELGKEAHNAFFATKVSFANQMRLLAEREGADPQQVMDIVTADRRNTTSHLDPMLGPFGGKCLPKDTRALAAYGVQRSVPVDLLDGVLATNAAAREHYENVDIAGQWPDVEARS